MPVRFIEIEIGREMWVGGYAHRGVPTPLLEENFFTNRATSGIPRGYIGRSNGDSRDRRAVQTAMRSSEALGGFADTLETPLARTKDDVCTRSFNHELIVTYITEKMELPFSLLVFPSKRDFRHFRDPSFLR